MNTLLFRYASIMSCELGGCFHCQEVIMSTSHAEHHLEDKHRSVFDRIALIDGTHDD